MKIEILDIFDAKTVIKMELVRNAMTHKELAERISRAVGKNVTKASIDNKLSRGGFSADFFLIALSVINSENKIKCGAG